MDVQEAAELLEAHGFRRVFHTNDWFRPGEDACFANYGEGAVRLVRVFGTTTAVPLFSTGTFVCAWALGRQLGDMFK